MYLLKELIQIVEVPPQAFSPQIHDYIFEKLKREMSTSLSARYGFIVAIQKVLSISEGIIRAGTGVAVFTVKFNAIIFHPFVGEVVDGTVDRVTKLGLYVSVGPCIVFIGKGLFPPDFTFQPDEYPQCYTHEDGSKLQSGSLVRLRIFNTTHLHGEIHCTGTMKEPYLGLLQDEGRLVETDEIETSF
ncbi:putative DNA-directed RNA polymerase II subunit rpb7 [Monocercomonoides exilis]|uniref:putative DNA-directed RNA polymerase II subunit rpb7 n=1 Tax=Monocercomonoides exilis TaxID=2049356 RepID=UPI003559CCB6|nr:putative DNA-directed RNA polymerase II subunit rpb7 [Monocercomonoides exilis]|eukprot:MONOS_7666.1-p1 / transcript=MONOS_7666.1 / gene=MONOS_7666 / organism=Monocercomonoides_exilis_PA203 / gene_product=DNA-directed RNA polymerase II subunit rpb7 / transcript_product=DNA-directed RNA polymerase II subunit rpb7 / location=Mono_scaffold00268:345-1181(+) / protein_length=186 / sequence_SO=supercontig / SO=protein_coding / is_pseudo=false